MVKPELLEDGPVTLAEARAALEKIKSVDSELSFRAGKCEDYLNDFVSLPAAKARELCGKLEGLGVSRLKQEHIVQIVDLLPQTPDEVKILFQGSTVSISKKDQEAIAKAVQEFK